jgi:hypothetical protein
MGELPTAAVKALTVPAQANKLFASLTRTFADSSAAASIM